MFISPVTIRRGLLELMSTKVKASQFVFNFNPMAGNIDFDMLEPILKVHICAFPLTMLLGNLRMSVD